MGFGFCARAAQVALREVISVAICVMWRIASALLQRSP